MKAEGSEVFLFDMEKGETGPAGDDLYGKLMMELLDQLSDKCVEAIRSLSPSEEQSAMLAMNLAQLLSCYCSQCSSDHPEIKAVIDEFHESCHTYGKKMFNAVGSIQGIQI